MISFHPVRTHEKTMRAEVQHINTTFVDSEMYSNQGRITRTVEDRIRGLVNNNNITIRIGESFHLQVPVRVSVVFSFTSIVDEKMGTSMETVIGEVQEIYTQRLKKKVASLSKENERLGKLVKSLSDFLLEKGFKNILLKHKLFWKEF